MFLGYKNVPDIHRLLTGAPDGIEKIRGAEISLTVALFLALAHLLAQQTGAKDLAQRIASLNLTGVAAAMQCLTPEVGGPRKGR